MSIANTIVGDEEIDIDADKQGAKVEKEVEKEPHQIETEMEAERLGMDYLKGSQERLDKEVENAEHDRFLVELDNSEDPKNLRVGYKWYLTVLSGCQILNATFASSVLSSAFALIEEEYNKSQEVVILTVSLFLVGYIVGPFFWSPLNELVGRKITFVSSLFLFVVFTIPCALAPNMACLLICRFLAGCCATASMVTSGGVLADLWPPVRRGRPMALYSLCPFAGPVAGPIASGFIVDYASDYKWVYWSQMIFGGACFLAVAFTYPETMVQVILKKKAQKMRRDTRDERYHTFSELNSPPFKEQLSIAFKRPFKMLCQEPIMIMTSLYIGVVYGVLYLSFEMFPYVFKGMYGFTTWEAGLTFCSVAIGLALSYATNLLFDKRYMRIAAKTIKETGERPAPEIRFLPAILVGGPCFSVGLFWFAWTAGRTHWMASCASGVLIGAGVVLCFISLLSYISDAYTLYAASALAANTVVRSIFGSVFPLFAIKMFDRLGIDWSGTLLACLGLLMMPFPVFFYRYGLAIRKRSNYARS